MLVLWASTALVLIGCGGGSPTGPITPPPVTPVTPAVIDTIDSISVVVGTVNTAIPSTVSASWNGGSYSASVTNSGNGLGRALLLIPQNYKSNVKVSVVGNSSNYPSWRDMTYDEYHNTEAGFSMVPRNFEGQPVDLAGLIRKSHSTDATMAFLSLYASLISGTGAYQYLPNLWPKSQEAISIAFDSTSSVSFTYSSIEYFKNGVMKANEAFGSTRFVIVPKAQANCFVSFKDGGGGNNSVSFSNSNITSCNVRIGIERISSDSAGSGVFSYFVLIHELIHGLGVGHSCSWKSIMVFSFILCSNQGSKYATLTDIAMFHLIEAVEYKRRDMRALNGFAEAYNGWMVMEMGGQPLIPLPGQPFELPPLN